MSIATVPRLATSNHSLARSLRGVSGSNITSVTTIGDVPGATHHDAACGVPRSPVAQLDVAVHHAAPLALSAFGSISDIEAPSGSGNVRPLSHASRSTRMPWASAIASSSQSFWSCIEPPYAKSSATLPLATLLLPSTA